MYVLHCGTSRWLKIDAPAGRSRRWGTDAGSRPEERAPRRWEGATGIVPAGIARHIDGPVVACYRTLPEANCGLHPLMHASSSHLLTSRPGALETLPDALLHQICLTLEPRDCIVLAAASRRLQATCSDPTMCREAASRHHLDPFSRAADCSWSPWRAEARRFAITAQALARHRGPVYAPVISYASTAATLRVQGVYASGHRLFAAEVEGEISVLFRLEGWASEPGRPALVLEHQHEEPVLCAGPPVALALSRTELVFVGRQGSLWTLREDLRFCAWHDQRWLTYEIAQPPAAMGKSLALASVGQRHVLALFEGGVELLRRGALGRPFTRVSVARAADDWPRFCRGIAFFGGLWAVDTEGRVAVIEAPDFGTPSLRVLPVTLAGEAMAASPRSWCRGGWLAAAAPGELHIIAGEGLVRMRLPLTVKCITTLVAVGGGACIIVGDAGGGVHLSNWRTAQTRCLHAGSASLSPAGSASLVCATARGRQLLALPNILRTQ